jgi:hypothetical protein
VAAAKKATARRPTAIVDLEEFGESYNILVYGDSGVGKTVLGGTAPNALLASAEPGAKAAKRQGSRAKLRRITSWADAMDLLSCLSSEDPAYAGFEWIIIDTADAIQKKGLKSILADAVAANPKRDPHIPALQDRMKWHLMFEDWVAQMIDLPVNTLWLAHTMRSEDEDGEDIVSPGLEGKKGMVSNYVCSVMDAVGYMSVTTNKADEPVRRILWERFPPYFAKDQYDRLGRWTDNATLPEIISLIESPKRRRTAAAK